MSAIEKRQDYRLPKSFRVEIREFRFPMARQPKYSIACANISTGGMLLECRKKFESGTKLQVKIFIPSFNKFHPGFLKVFESDAGQFFQAIAEIVHTHDIVPLTSYALGVKFLDIDSDDWTALRRFIIKSR